MRFDSRVFASLVLFLGALVLLRQGIVLVTSEIPQLQKQVKVMQQRDIEPAALFYTDSRTALQAIDRVEQQLRGRSPLNCLTERRLGKPDKTVK